MSTKSSQKPTAKGSSDSAILGFDLLSNLTYMAAVSAGGVTQGCDPGVDAAAEL